MDVDEDAAGIESALGLDSTYPANMLIILLARSCSNRQRQLVSLTMLACTYVEIDDMSLECREPEADDD